MPAIALDSTGLKRKLRRTVSAAQKAQRNAARDAARQTRTQAGRMATETLNIKRAELTRKSRRGKAPLDKPKPSRGGKSWDLRIAYAQIPAHRFSGWRYTHRRRGRLFRETATRATFAKQGRGGLTVRFGKRRGALTFAKAFRTPSVGGGTPFIQRKGRSRYPLEAIKGPSVHSALKKRVPELVAHGRAALKRRGEYWKTRLTRPLR